MPVKTRFLIMSDTHSRSEDIEVMAGHKADVVIHCGDLSQYSELPHYRASIELLRRLDAPLKLVIAGNHDQSLQEDRYDEMLAMKTRWWANNGRDAETVRRLFGPRGEPRRLLTSPEARAAGIVYLDEGNYSFQLRNGATLRVYACPWTPANWRGRGFQYAPQEGHDFRPVRNVDVAITHGPPRGILDWTSSGNRAGCPQLFGAIARARPRLHCFGHIHGAWGAKLATWRDDVDGDRRGPRGDFSVNTHIDLDDSVPLEKLPNMIPARTDSRALVRAKAERKAAYDRQGFCHTSHVPGDAHPLVPGKHTLFVNAAYEFGAVGLAAGIRSHWPWLVDIELPSKEEAARENINPYA